MQNYGVKCVESMWYMCQNNMFFLQNQAPGRNQNLAPGGNKWKSFQCFILKRLAKILRHAARAENVTRTKKERVS